MADSVRLSFVLVCSLGLSACSGRAIQASGGESESSATSGSSSETRDGDPGSSSVEPDLGAGPVAKTQRLLEVLHVDRQHFRVGRGKSDGAGAVVDGGNDDASGGGGAAHQLVQLGVRNHASLSDPVERGVVRK